MMRDLSSYTGGHQRYYFYRDAKVIYGLLMKRPVRYRQAQLEARNITAPVIMGNYIAVGDAEGYLHWLMKRWTFCCTYTSQ